MFQGTLISYKKKMRYRRPKDFKEKLDGFKKDYLLENPSAYKGRWNDKFLGKEKLFLEIGVGKGQFLYEMVKKYEQNAYIGMEKIEALLIQSCQRAKDEALQNICFMGQDAHFLEDYFEKDELDGIYLNFSDPWKKKRQAKRRLTHIDMLEKYARICKNEAILHFKTDNRTLFDFSVEALSHSDYEIVFLSYDLHREESRKDNIVTEYERYFSNQGIPICKAECILRK